MQVARICSLLATFVEQGVTSEYEGLLPAEHFVKKMFTRLGSGQGPQPLCLITHGVSEIRKIGK